MNARLIIDSNDRAVWFGAEDVPGLTITQDTMEAVYAYQRTHPNLDIVLFDLHINAAIVAELLKMNRDSQ